MLFYHLANAMKRWRLESVGYFLLKPVRRGENRRIDRFTYDLETALLILCVHTC